MKFISLFIFLLLDICFVFCKVTDSINSDIVNAKVDRKVDISTHLVKIHTTVLLENSGKTPAKNFLLVTDSSLENNVAFFGASIKDHEDETLNIVKTTINGHSDKQFRRVTLPKPLDAGKTLSVVIDSTYTHALSPYPAEISQAEKQFVVYSGNLYFFSPYKTKTQSTTVVTASSNIESYTKTKPVSQSDTTISYGPYESREPFTVAELKVHVENLSPFLTVTSMERIIEISHWGNIAVEEHIDIRHSGALLKGPFSRYDYQRQQDASASIKSYKTVLPASARDVYYRDEIGNISTSNLKELDDSVELELRPRFPLFGGWKTQYYIGYNVPSYEYLYHQDDQYVLKMRFIDHIYDDMVIDQLKVKIILPEGSSELQLNTPFSVKKQDGDLHYTYLDTVGRPVILAYKTNLVEHHIQDFELNYRFQKFLLLREPLLVVGAFYLLFLIVIIYVRLDFSITKDEAKESKMRVASLVEDVQSAQDKRSALYQSYDDAVNKFKSSKDINNFTSSRKKIDGDYRQLTQQIQAIQAQLKTEGSDAAEKVLELQKLDNQYKEQISLAINYAERLLNGKLSKQAYLDVESATNVKREEIYQKMENLRATL